MDRNLKETAVRNSNEIHENDGSANTRMRAKCPLWARIVLACGAVLLLLVAGVAAVNLSASITFNQATASLNANIKAAQDESTDITTLKAQQQQTDAQFDEAGRMRTLLLPQVKDAIDTNASISSELTKITLKQAEAQNSGSDSGQAQSAQQSENSSSNAKKGGALTDEQKKQVEELMKANPPIPSRTPPNPSRKRRRTRVPGLPSRGKQSFTVVLFSHTLTGHGFIAAVSRFRLSALAFIQFSIGHG